MNAIEACKFIIGLSILHDKLEKEMKKGGF